MPPKRSLPNKNKNNRNNKQNNNSNGKIQFNLNNQVVDDEEIDSDLENSDIESSDGEISDEETTEQKRRRIAKEYLESMKDMENDEEEDDIDIHARDENVTSILRQRRLESQGKYFR